MCMIFVNLLNFMVVVELATVPIVAVAGTWGILSVHTANQFEHTIYVVFSGEQSFKQVLFSSSVTPRMRTPLRGT